MNKREKISVIILAIWSILMLTLFIWMHGSVLFSVILLGTLPFATYELRKQYQTYLPSEYKRELLGVRWTKITGYLLILAAVPWSYFGLKFLDVNIEHNQIILIIGIFVFVGTGFVVLNIVRLRRVLRAMQRKK